MLYALRIQITPQKSNPCTEYYNLWLLYNRKEIYTIYRLFLLFGFSLAGQAQAACSAAILLGLYKTAPKLSKKIVPDLVDKERRAC